ncbi:MAG: diacylglycerol kinase [Desulfohalobiaceae bacterium]|nr:diacylglycerol kinase [Desulfohalobiaceae bacterium]
MSAKSNHGISRLVQAFRYSWAGLRWIISHEVAFRQEVASAVVLIPVALWLGDSPVEQALLISSLLLILLTELLNSGIEAAVDRVGAEFHPLAQRAKDLGSAAVFLALVHAGVVWGIIVLPSLISRF